jgi:hypothetical protein
MLSLSIALVACTKQAPTPPVAGAPSGPVTFRVLQQGRNPRPCVDGPDSQIAIDEDAWIGVFDRQTACMSAPDITLPRVRFGTEVAVAVWWGAATCEALDVEVTAAERRGDELILKATTSAKGACPTRLGGLESFVALERSSSFDGSQRLALELDGNPVAP